MNRTRVETYFGSLCRQDLEHVREEMSQEEKNELAQKMESFIGNIYRLSSYEAMLLAKDMFEWGYLAAHVDVKKDERG